MINTGEVLALIKAFGGKVSQSAIEESVSDYIDDHPELVTTVQDGSITYAKLDSELKDSVDDVSDLKSAIDGKADASDIPTKVSDLVDDSGHYTKPVGGIPASDLASGVIPDISGKQNAPATAGTAGQVLGLDNNLAPVWVDQTGGSVDPAVIAEAVDDWLDEHPEAVTTVEDGSITFPKLNSAVHDTVVITDESEKSYSHNVAPTKVTVYPNDYTQNIPVRYIGKENLLLDTIVESGSYGGITRTKDGRFIKLSGTGTGGFQFFNTTDTTQLAKFAGKTVNVCMYIKKSTSWENSSYFAFRVNNSTTISRTNISENDNELIGWSVIENIEVPETLTQVRLYFNSLSGSVFANGDYAWLGIYESTPTVTQTIVTTDPVDITVSNLNMIDTMMHESTVETIVPTKQYVDSHTPDIIGYWSDNVYVMPEAFGAVGDGVADDTTAIGNCIAYAVANNKAVKGYGSYKVSGTVVLDSADLDVYLKTINYTGNGSAVQISGTDIQFGFHKIISTGIGIEFKKVTGKSCLRNRITGNSITSNNECFYCGESSYYGTCDVRYLNSNNGNCITFQMGGEPVTEYIFRSCSCRCPNGYIAYCPVDSKFYDFTVEANCKYGLMNPDGCVCVGWRHREQIDSIARQIEGLISTTNGALIITNTILKDNMFRYIASDPLYWYSIDTSLTKGYDEIPSAPGSTDAWNALGLFNYVIDVPVHGSGQLTQTLNAFEMIAKKTYIIGGNKVFVPFGRKTVTISSSTYDYRLFDSMVAEDIVACSQMHWGTDFIIDTASTDIYFHASHCAVGYNDLTVTQEDGNYAMIYDKQENLLFDGQTLGDGKYSLKCIMDSESCGRLSYETTWWCYDGTNEKWEITKIE